MARYSLAYEGDALADGGMDLLELAPAMLAIGQLLQSANAHANGDRAKLDVKVYPLRKGSMMIDLGTHVSLVDAALTLLGGITVAKANEIFKFVFGNKGLMEVLRNLRGQPPTASKPDDKGRVSISISDSPGAAVLVVDSTVAAMVQDASDRRLAEVIVRPMRRAGVDALTRIEGARSTTIATKEDVPAFERGKSREVEATVVESVSETTTVVVPRIQATYPGPMWRVRPQGAEIDFYVTITDQEFLVEYIGGRIDLRPGDGLRVVLRTRNRTDDRGTPVAEYTVTKVHGIEKGIRGTQQTLLPRTSQRAKKRRRRR